MITAGVCESYYEEILKGTHDAGDTYRMALFGKDAALSPLTTVYSPSKEISGKGYEQGGQVLTGFLTGRWSEGGKRGAYLTWSSPQWPKSTITAFGWQIYNASKGNKSVVVGTFKKDVTSTVGPFDVFLPFPGATALIRLQLP